MCSGSVTWLRCAARAPSVRPGAARMTGNSLPLMEDLDDGAADAGIDLLPDQPERHGIPRTVDLDVIVGRDAGALPAGECVGLRWQWLEVRPVDRGEEIGAAGAVAAHDPHVQLVQQPPDRGVQVGQREEPQVAQPGVAPEARLQHDDPALRDLHGDFHLGLVAGLVRTCRQDRRAVMAGRLGIGPVQARIKAVGLEHRGLQVVRCPAGDCEAICRKGGTTTFGTPPRNVNIRTCAPIQSSSPSDPTASA